MQRSSLEGFTAILILNAHTLQFLEIRIAERYQMYQHLIQRGTTDIAWVS